MAVAKSYGATIQAAEVSDFLAFLRVLVKYSKSGSLPTCWLPVPTTLLELSNSRGARPGKRNYPSRRWSLILNPILNSIQEPIQKRAVSSQSPQQKKMEAKRSLRW